MKMTKLYFLLKKRLLKKASFIAILLCIPLLAGLFSHFAKNEETGLLRIAICAEESDAYTEGIIESISEGSRVILFRVAENEEAALESVRRGKSDGAWVFKKGLSENVRKLAEGEKVSIIKAYECEESLFAVMAREQVFSCLYADVARIMYENYAGETVDSAEREDIIESYKKTLLEGDLVSFEFENVPVSLEEENYLTAPLRGLLSVMVLLSALAAALYYISDEKEGTYDLVRREARGAVLYMTVLCAVTLSVTVMTLSLIFTGEYTDFLRESAAFLLLIFSSAGLSLLLGTLFFSVRAFASLLPLVAAGALVFSPVFFDLTSLKAFQVLFPTYHYLYAAGGVALLPFAVYCIALNALAFGLHFALSRFRK